MAHFKYSVGDRVRVLREITDEAFFDGVVIKVHLRGAGAVKYAKTGTVGVSLTAAEHILQLMGG